MDTGDFGGEAFGILAPRPGIEPAPPVLEGEVLTSGPPGKSPFIYLNGHWYAVTIRCLSNLDKS